MVIDSIRERILQVEVVLSPREFDEQSRALDSVVATLSSVAGDVTPVITNPVFKYGLSDNQVTGTAKAFQQRLIRQSGVDVRQKIATGAEHYAELMGLSGDFSRDAGVKPSAVSEWIMTLSTRASFVDALGALDTEGVKQRVERLRSRGGWMICILDASEGVFVTRRGTEQLVDTLLEAQHGDILDTKIDPEVQENPDIPVFSQPQSFTRFMRTKGLLKVPNLPEDDAYPESVMDMAEMYEMFMTQDQPDNPSLQDFEQWIFKEGSFQYRHKEYLLAIRDEMQTAFDAPHAEAREDIVKQIRASLTDALTQGLEPHIVRECARVINWHVLANRRANALGQ